MKPDAQPVVKARKCAHCGAEMPAEAGGKHCLGCLLRLGLAAADEANLQDPKCPPGQTVKATTTTPDFGNRIGPYKLWEKIGEGGCGMVYVAEQEDPIRRRVALKIIKLGLETKQVIARFEAERQALALMDHPNIAKVLDAGTTDNGRPYFVMELVNGVPINRYCDQHRLSTHKRLDLFVQVCQAIQHAHQKGIIHRDIKPSNVLVGDHDGVAVPKVIDFGIAKAALGQTLTDKTVYTALEQFLGTPAYMSPEQAMLSGLDIDTRSDIYSLGVLLYELLTSKTPFDARKLLEAGFNEMLRTIRDQDPPRPSTRLSTLDASEQMSLALHQGTEAPKLARIIRGDLDWIVMKCLEKDRIRRYDTANGLGRDIERYLTNEPISARPPSNAYKLKKFAGRNKLAVSAAVVVGLALAAGFAISMWALLMERDARHDADQRRILAKANESKAELETTKSRAVAERESKLRRRADTLAESVKDVITGMVPDMAMSRDMSVLRDILDKATQNIGQKLNDEPELQVEMLSTIGGAYTVIGEFKRAEATYRRILTLTSGLPSERAATAEALVRLADTFTDEQSRTNYPEGEACCRRALGIWEKLLGPASLESSGALMVLGDLLRQRDALLEAEDTFRAAWNIRRAKKGERDRVTIGALDALAAVTAARGNTTQAEVMFRDVVAYRREFTTVETGQSDAILALDVAHSLNHLGEILETEGRLPEAEQAFSEVLALRRRWLGEHPFLADSMAAMARVQAREGRSAESEKLRNEELALRSKLQSRLRHVP